MLKIRRSRNRLIFNMGIPVPGKEGLYIETGPCFFSTFAESFHFRSFQISFCQNMNNSESKRQVSFLSSYLLLSIIYLWCLKHFLSTLMWCKFNKNVFLLCMWYQTTVCSLPCRWLSGFRSSKEKEDLAVSELVQYYWGWAGSQDRD